MATAMLGQPMHEASATHFMLDAHHLAVLDRFVARARRRATHSGRQFAGVMVEIHPNRPLTFHAAGLTSQVLALEPLHRW